MREPTYAEISALAYQLYLEDGRPHGEAEFHWHRAVEILRHPEAFSPDNVLSPPSEPEITRNLDAKAEVLDSGLPSDPHSGPKAFHQHVEFAAGSRSAAAIRKELKGITGIESVEKSNARGTVRIAFDARRTNAAAIIDVLTPEVDALEPEEQPV
jgi:copper chaperone CopZ